MLTEFINNEIHEVLEKADKIGVVLDYIVVKSEYDSNTIDTHKKVALFGMEIIDKRLEKYAISRADDEFPIDRFYRVKIINEDINGIKISMKDFWGNDDAFPKELAKNVSWSIPNADGYKTAFLNPPYGLSSSFDEQLSVFDQICSLLLSPTSDENLEIFKWNDDWSNYFDSGKEWWGTFYWTIHNKEKSIYIVIGGSSTD